MGARKVEPGQKIISLVMEVLGDLGIPGTGSARAAVEETARLLKKRERQRELAEALRKAEENFRAAARLDRLVSELAAKIAASLQDLAPAESQAWIWWKKFGASRAEGAAGDERVLVLLREMAEGLNPRPESA